MSNGKWRSVALLLAFWPVGAYGYIDPGSGLLLLQGLISAIVGGLFIARRTISRMVARMARTLGLSRGKPNQDEPPSGPR